MFLFFLIVISIFTIFIHYLKRKKINESTKIKKSHSLDREVYYLRKRAECQKKAQEQQTQDFLEKLNEAKKEYIYDK